jgi:hypothetical protein
MQRETAGREPLPAQQGKAQDRERAENVIQNHRPFLNVKRHRRKHGIQD